MLREWIDLMRTDCPAPLRRLGHAYAAVAFTARARRCRTVWAPHQARSRAAILDAAGAGGDTVLILGAGPCLDIPVADLRERFRRLILVDTAFPPGTPHGEGIERQNLDLTGVGDRVTADGPLPDPGCIALLDRPGIDLVVSTNLVSQLPLLPLAAAGERTAVELTGFARRIVQAHLDHLRAFACPVLLIGDVRRTTLGADGDLLEVEDPLFGVELPPGPEWDWTVAPVGELSGGRSQRTRVRAARLR